MRASEASDSYSYWYENERTEVEAGTSDSLIAKLKRKCFSWMGAFLVRKAKGD